MKNNNQTFVSKLMREYAEKFGLIGSSPGMERVVEVIDQVAPSTISVMIVGESGTGKEVVANAIQGKSNRVKQPFVVVNCAAIPEGILESELFGHEKGAFTGAIGARKGYFEMAHTGTIFLDEIGEMPIATQAKLLRVLEGGEFMRVGGSETRKVDVRVIAATNRNLEEAVKREEFRQDLYYRLNTVKIKVPPLRERRSDIRNLTLKFANAFCAKNKIEFHGFTEGALEALESYPWPGNVRELRNVIESVIIMEQGEQINQMMLTRNLPAIDTDFNRSVPVPLSKSSDQAEREMIYAALLDLKHEMTQLKEILMQRLFPPRQLPSADRFPIYASPSAVNDDEIIVPDENKPETMQEMERNLIYEALKRNGGNKRKAARQLQISERTLYRKIKEYDIRF